MAEPTSAYSVYDLMLRVAKAASVAYYGSSGTGKAMVPIDEYKFERVLDVVNDGIKFFIASAPPSGWRWMNREMTVTLVAAVTGTAEAGTSTSLTDSGLAGTYADNYFNGCIIKITAGTGIGETATVTGYTGATGKFDFSAGLSGSSTPDTTSQFRIGPSTSVIDGDVARYQLADDFQGEVSGDITYDEDTNVGRITWVHEAEIRRLREMTVETGDANRAAVRPYTGRRWELIVDPRPQASKVVTFPYKAGFAAMQAASGDASSGSSTTIVDSTIANWYPDNYFNTWTIYVLNGTGKNSHAVVTDYTGSTGTFTVANWLAIDGVSSGTSPGANSIYFVTNGTTHPAGMQFDEAVLSACLAKAELEFEDLQIGYMDKFLSKDLPDAWNIDARSAPRKLGPMLPGTRDISYPAISDDRDRRDVTYS